MSPLPTVRELTGQATGWLAERGVPSARLDADLMLAHALGLRRLDLYLDLDRPLEPAEVASFRELVRRRGRREPLAYVLGSWSFRGLELATDARALVPRPETEWLVERALARLDTEAPRVLDVGTGSGAIAISIAVEMPDAVVTAVDVSPDALALAAHNATTHGVRIDLRQSDLLAAVQGEQFDLVLANLPYVGEGDPVDPEVESFEPALAVYAPDSGRALIERLIAEVPSVTPRWPRRLELGAGQAPWALEQLGGPASRTRSPGPTSRAWSASRRLSQGDHDLTRVAHEPPRAAARAGRTLPACAPQPSSSRCSRRACSRQSARRGLRRSPRCAARPCRDRIQGTNPGDIDHVDAMSTGSSTTGPARRHASTTGTANLKRRLRRGRRRAFHARRLRPAEGPARRRGGREGDAVTHAATSRPLRPCIQQRAEIGNRAHADVAIWDCHADGGPPRRARVRGDRRRRAAVAHRADDSDGAASDLRLAGGDPAPSCPPATGIAPSNCSSGSNGIFRSNSTAVLDS